MLNALEIRNLRKTYKGFSLKDVSFDLPQGTIMGLVGPNGAGKTTIIKSILNLVRRDAGEILIYGQDNRSEEKAVKARIGFVHETPGLVDDAPLKNIAAAVAPFYPSWDAGLFNRLVGEFELPLEKKFKKLSHGMKMKFALALALAHDADLLILDEPTSGLDPVFRRELLERLSGVIQDERKAVLFSTHIASDLERTADYVTFVQDGSVLISARCDTIRDHWAVVKGGPELLDPARRNLFQAVHETSFGAEALSRDMAAVRAAFPEAVIDRASFEDICVLLDQGATHV
jgi:ABC-2 type transport system ATP-binding protein